jgi:hypothetical protein
MEHFDVRKQNVIIRDPVSKKSILVDSKHDFRQASSFTEALVRFQRDVFNINIVNFFLIVSRYERAYDEPYDEYNYINDHKNII